MGDKTCPRCKRTDALELLAWETRREGRTVTVVHCGCVPTEPGIVERGHPLLERGGSKRAPGPVVDPNPPATSRGLPAVVPSKQSASFRPILAPSDRARALVAAWLGQGGGNAALETLITRALAERTDDAGRVLERHAAELKAEDTPSARRDATHAVHCAALVRRELGAR